MKQLISKCIQPERLLHLKVTSQEMFQVSALIYGGISLIALVALLFPSWPALDRQGIFYISVLGLLLSSLFYFYRATAPLWIAIVHIPLGVFLANLAVYMGHSEQSFGFSIIFVISSAYLFHYITKLMASIILLLAMFLFALTLNFLSVEGWPAMVAFTTGNCFLMGLIVWLITRRMHQLNIKDSLTGLINRQTIDAITVQFIEQFNINKKGFIFMMIDLNKFKKINDTRGHLEGDRVLIQFSRILEECIETTDHAARWGGDEFIILLNGDDQHRVDTFETSLRQKTQNIIGFEVGTSHPQQGDSLDSLMHRADQNMYLNKHNRRATDIG